MNELIPINKDLQGRRVVSARDLHEYLEISERFNSWCIRMFEYGFTENLDFTSVKNFTLVNNGAQREIQDYALTVDTAKEISMLQRSERGKHARQYFIACEKALIQQPMSIEDMIIASAQNLKQVKAQMSALENKVDRIEAQARTRPNYFTIVGYATLHKIQVGIKIASSLGKRASDYCKRHGILMEQIPDPRFGVIKTYPEDVLKIIFNEHLN